MANKIGEVLEIETEESYIKRPAGPLIIIELKDISKLPGYIRIPSMAEGAETDDMIMQRILYSGLLNQCRKCRRFGHHARTCTTNRNKPWERVPSSVGPPSTSAPVRKQSDGGAPHPKQDQGSGLPQSLKVKSTQARNRMNPVHSEVRNRSEHPTESNINNRSDKPPRANSQLRSSSKAEAPGSSEADYVMTEQASFLELKPISISQELSRQLEIIRESKAKPNFGLQNVDSPLSTQPEDKNIGGWECTILAHISTGSSAISVQNKRHLHWRSSDSLMDMNNDIEFAGLAHNLLLKSGRASTERQVRMNEVASQMASPLSYQKEKVH
ncbi:unnamed protein product [Sphagnum troendelagicum]|uniref:CCHC-type domain-containing protein n=1 Tax=Sphagnum troendelagicum TaxID=128251 RepID=A0ABP0UF09_9BRYO